MYTAFVVDVCSRHIVGWRTALSMATPLVMDALNMAMHSRRTQLIDGVIVHSDAGSQYVAIAYSERLAEIGRFTPDRGTTRQTDDTAAITAGMLTATGASITVRTGSAPT